MTRPIAAARKQAAALIAIPMPASRKTSPGEINRLVHHAAAGDEIPI
jgi:hypothetical protein